jgi:hypothetical protein
MLKKSRGSVAFSIARCEYLLFANFGIMNADAIQASTAILDAGSAAGRLSRNHCVGLGAWNLIRLGWPQQVYVSVAD